MIGVSLGEGAARTDIHWYPGHMAKTRRMLAEQLRAVDAAIELCDARAPEATRNPELNALLNSKPRLLVLNKADLADDAMTARWLDFHRRAGTLAIRQNSNGGDARAALRAIERLSEPLTERLRARGVRKTVRLIVVGIPNVGKSTFINRLLGSRSAIASDRPGVTRARQWFKVGPYLELMDTPGLLWPKLSDQNAARLMAFLGSIRDETLDGERLAEELIETLARIAPESLERRFRIGGAEGDGGELLRRVCAGRGFRLPGDREDVRRAAMVALDEFRAGKIGRITLESPRGAEDGA